MSRAFRRFEILLPLRFNDGHPVPDGLIADTLLELREQFGAISAETQTIHGVWQHEGQSFGMIWYVCLLTPLIYPRTANIFDSSKNALNPALGRSTSG
jgi:hypothetical protein